MSDLEQQLIDAANNDLAPDCDLRRLAASKIKLLRESKEFWTKAADDENKQVLRLQAGNEGLRADFEQLHKQVFEGLKELSFRYPPSEPHITKVVVSPDHEGRNKAIGLLGLRRGMWDVSEKYPEFCAKPDTSSKGDSENE